MADDSQDACIVPTAIHLQEPSFPSGNSADHAHGPSLKTSAIHGRLPKPTSKIDAPQNDMSEVQRPFADRHSSSEPPLQIPRKSETERPRAKPRPSLLGRKRSIPTARPIQLGRQATLSFDPYSDSSSSSDEDDASLPTVVHDGAEDAPQRDAKSRTPKEPRSGPFSMFKIANDQFNTRGRVSKKDGRLRLSINETVNSGYFAKTLGAGLKRHFRGGDDAEGNKSPTAAENPAFDQAIPENDLMEDPERRVKLNIVVIVIGSRGDIQPFLRIGKILKEEYGHRVRIATHPAFKKFVEEDSRLEFFSVGGDPSELMAFMVKNPGLIPSMDTIKEGEIGKRRAAMYEMFQGMWRACINSTDDESDEANLQMMGNKHPFVADAIIANPPSFAPPHIAERLGVPLHMMFTFPYTPTVQFPHPLANIKASNVDANYTNFMSYPLVEMMTWQGLGDLINRFRSKTLHLEMVSTLWAPGQLYRLQVPYTYMWSPSLVPKPKDWGPEIDIAGFVFLDLASSFEPPEDLAKFLNAGPPPVYIGFGSIVVDDPDKFTSLIFEAVEMAGVRALVSKGWGGLGEDNANTPDNIFMLENTPHDWLFPKVSAVVHHGGAGTTAIGLKCAKPTMIVPFFGDQPFWGGMVSKAKAGAHECIPFKKLTAEILAEGIKQCLTDEAKNNVQKIADSIANEGDAAKNAVRSFHRSLPFYGEHNMRCQMLDNRVAVWKLRNTSLRLSALAAELLVEWKKIKWNELRLLRHFEWNDFGGPGEPITGLWGAAVGTASDVATGVGLMPVKMAKSVKHREQYYQKRWRVKKRQKHAQETLAKVNDTTPNATVTANDNMNGTKASRPTLPNRKSTTLSTLSEPEDYLAEELAQEAGHGFKKASVAILKTPMNMTLALTQGFHNAPRLYGDETVRRPPRITGFHSGLRAGRDEFVWGVYDGITGLWTQPYHGAKEGGVLGLLQGVGMGIGGFVLKDIAAFLGPGAYAMKGLDEESRKKYQPTRFLRRARIMQGQADLAALSSQRPRRNSSASAASDREDQTPTDGKKANKHDTEMLVAKKWDEIQHQLLQEKKNDSGLCASLFGRAQHKQGQAVPRKSISSSGRPSNVSKTAGANLSLDHASSEPIDKANVTGGLKKEYSAPGASMQFKEKGARRKMHRIDPVAGALKEEAKQQGTKTNQVPNVWQASLEGSGKAVGGGNSLGEESQDEKKGLGNGHLVSDRKGDGEAANGRLRSESV
ncbi:UDP-Glycosyltransferase/glycogen phosphorylase [Polyplosphaeria fusca]|uniref:UDP-Glycosyltransferase/glycogen phosphorylase n=1 Tax=Polyplosphaeria fusca TaxID=682080 RepID=A0A9P4QU24_9PLEO|nr:UDP-Glycosyltransferase/glycogen phosphorylase [Polyplosphaeria fusca]